MNVHSSDVKSMSGGVGELREGGCNLLHSLDEASGGDTSRRAVVLPREEGNQAARWKIYAGNGWTVKVTVADVSPLRRHHRWFARFPVKIVS